MDKKEYKLRCTLIGHSEDVRAIDAFQNGGIISGSRDKTTRIWTLNENGDYNETQVLKDHKHFVGSVCTLNATEKYPQDLIITGSNDHHINIYLLGQLEPVKTIKAHNDTVCNIRRGHEEATFLSSSWDMSAKLWNLNDDLTEAKLVLHGHTLAVWCVADLPSGKIVTGSADKSIIVWLRNGTKLHKIEGHTDCVRDFASINHDEFLSCANDATVRHWNADTGICLKIFYGHDHYIYSISSTLDGQLFATSGEDKTVRVWKDGELKETINFAISSIWCVKILENGDIAAGSSDGLIRIFSACPDRWADSETLKAWDAEIEKVQKLSQLQENVKVNELPSVSALGQPGSKDGQTKMVNENGQAIAYSWSQSSRQWVKIGEVVGSSDNSSKQLYNGKEYDYIFSIDIQEGAPPLKLPYNRTEDPWLVAQKFIHQYELDQMFLEQIANFIIKNSTAVTNLNTNSEFMDPFTGGNRYIPASNNSNYNSTISQSNISSLTSSEYIPHKNYLKFEQANVNAIFDKLKEFNSKQDTVHKLSDEKLNALDLLIKEKIIETGVISEILWTLLDWPAEYLFPVLDIIRLAVLQPHISDFIINGDIIKILKRHLMDNSLPANQMLTFRLLTNMFNQEKGELLNLEFSDDILQLIFDLSSLGNKNNQIAITTYILNLTIAINKMDLNLLKILQLLNIIMKIFLNLNENEAIFRLLVAFGTLIILTNNINDKKQLIQVVKESESTVNLLKIMSDYHSTDINIKISKCSKQIVNFIN